MSSGHAPARHVRFQEIHRAVYMLRHARPPDAWKCPVCKAMAMTGPMPLEFPDGHLVQPISCENCPADRTVVLSGGKLRMM